MVPKLVDRLGMRYGRSTVSKEPSLTQGLHPDAAYAIAGKRMRQWKRSPCSQGETE